MIFTNLRGKHGVSKRRPGAGCGMEVKDNEGRDRAAERAGGKRVV